MRYYIPPVVVGGQVSGSTSFVDYLIALGISAVIVLSVIVATNYVLSKFNLRSKLNMSTKIYSICFPHWTPGIEVVYGEFLSHKEAVNFAEKTKACRVWGYKIIEQERRKK